MCIRSTQKVSTRNERRNLKTKGITNNFKTISLRKVKLGYLKRLKCEIDGKEYEIDESEGC